MWAKEVLVVAFLLFATICGSNAQCRFDVVFLIDSSSSVGSRGTAAANLYIRDAIECMNGYGYDVSVGVTQFTCLSTVHVPLGQFALNDPGLSAAVENIGHSGGLSRIGPAMRQMKDTANFRSGVPRVAVVLTDGEGQGDVNNRMMDDYAEQAEAGRQAGITMYAVATGMFAFLDTAALTAIAGEPGRVLTTHFGRHGCALAATLAGDICG